jgi:tRNA-specific 2-thiouridylase
MEDARASSQRLDLPFYPVNFEQEFERHVIDYFLEEYAAGRTPNPCLECNRYVKFHHLITKARAVGADFLATGHYARIERDASGRYHLHQAADPDKDQAYVLYPLNQEQLSYLLFPLGRLQKREVREIAVAFGLPVAEKPDSMETCFVGKGAYADFVLRRRPGLDQPGDIADRHGRVLGRHNGLIHYTVGQRKGIGVAAKEPLYVLELDTRTNRLVVGTRRELGFSSLLAERTAWVGGAAPTGAIDCEVQLRYRGTRYPALVEPLDEGRFRVNFAEPPQAVAPGQSAVLYQDDEVLGGGVIAESRTLLPLAGAAA